MIRGPVAPIPPSFDPASGRLETDDVRPYIRFLVAGGFRTLVTTAGTSQFNLMSLSEIRAFNAACREAAEEVGAELITGLPPLSDRFLTEEIVRVNEFSCPILLLFPERYYGDAHVADHFIAAADISANPVYIHAKPMVSGSGGSVDFSPDLVSRLVAHPKIMGMKEECSTLALGFELAASLGKRDFSLIAAGGSQRRFMLLHAAGASAFLAGAGSVLPEADVGFHGAMEKNDMDEARRYLRLETDLFNVFMNMGWHKALRTALRQMGFVRGDRRPFPAATAQEHDCVGAALHALIRGVCQ